MFPVFLITFGEGRSGGTTSTVILTETHLKRPSVPTRPSQGDRRQVQPFPPRAPTWLPMRPLVAPSRPDTRRLVGVHPTPRDAPCKKDEDKSRKNLTFFSNFPATYHDSKPQRYTY